MRRPPRSAWLCLLLTVPGCGDNIAAVLRDYYNVEHEILDNMSKIADDDSAKSFNEVCNKRLQPKEKAVNERREKIERNQFQEADRKALALEIELLETGPLKAQITSLDARFRILQNRQRRLLVKLSEDQAAQAKAQGQSFTIDASKNWPNLSAVELPEKLGKGPNAGGGMAPMMPAMPMMPPGAPGGAGPPGGAPMQMGGPAVAEQKAPAGPAVDPKYNSIRFVLTCERVGNGWDETRAWKLGNTVVYSNKGGTKLLSPDGIDLTPLTSN